MESAQVQVRSFKVGFRLGYLHVVQVLELARAADAHPNKRVAAIINEAFDITIKALRDELESTIRGLDE